VTIERAILISVFAAIAVALVLAGRYLRVLRNRQRAREWLEMMASHLGLKRKPTETDEELRERMRLVMSSVPLRGTKNELTAIIAANLWDHGYPRTDVELVTLAPGHVQARVSGKVPENVLRSVEKAVENEIPIGMHLELVGQLSRQVSQQQGDSSPDR